MLESYVVKIKEEETNNPSPFLLEKGFWNYYTAKDENHFDSDFLSSQAKQIIHLDQIGEVELPKDSIIHDYPSYLYSMDDKHKLYLEINSIFNPDFSDDSIWVGATPFYDTVKSLSSSAFSVAYFYGALNLIHNLASSFEKINNLPKEAVLLSSAFIGISLSVGVLYGLYSLDNSISKSSDVNSKE